LTDLIKDHGVSKILGDDTALVNISTGDQDWIAQVAASEGGRPKDRIVERPERIPWPHIGNPDSVDAFL
jgi:hypothetical protein